MTGAVHKDTVRRWKDFAPDIQVDLVKMAQNVLRYNVVIVGRFFNKGAGSLKYGEESTQRTVRTNKMAIPRESLYPRREQNTWVWNLSAVCVPSSGTPPPRGVRLMPAGRGNPNEQNEQTNQPT